MEPPREAWVKAPARATPPFRLAACGRLRETAPSSGRLEGATGSDHTDQAAGIMVGPVAAAERSRQVAMTARGAGTEEGAGPATGQLGINQAVAGRSLLFPFARRAKVTTPRTSAAGRLLPVPGATGTAPMEVLEGMRPGGLATAWEQTAGYAVRVQLTWPRRGQLKEVESVLTPSVSPGSSTFKIG